MWGGFYAGNNGYYLVEGVSNTDESDTAEVIRVIKYDKIGTELEQHQLQETAIYLVEK